MSGKIPQADYDLKGHTYDGRTCTSYLPDADVATLEDACKVVANMRFVDGHVRTAAKHPRRCAHPANRAEPSSVCPALSQSKSMATSVRLRKRMVLKSKTYILKMC